MIVGTRTGTVAGLTLKPMKLWEVDVFEGMQSPAAFLTSVLTTTIGCVVGSSTGELIFLDMDGSPLWRNPMAAPITDCSFDAKTKSAVFCAGGLLSVYSG